MLCCCAIATNVTKRFRLKDSSARLPHCTGTRGAALRRAIDECDSPQLAAILLRVVRVSSGNVVATPGSMRSFRSKLLSATYAFGSFTAFPTWNPSESTSDAVLRFGGCSFGYDAVGWPDDEYPNSTRRLQIVAARPAASASFFQAAISAIEKVAYGWEPGDTSQNDPECLFGKVSRQRRFGQSQITSV